MKNFSYILFFVLALVGCEDTAVQNSEEDFYFESISYHNQYFAGDLVMLKFKTNKTDNTFLLVTNAFGSTLIKPNFQKGNIAFTLPKIFAEKSGVCSWHLINNNRLYSKGQISILPKNEKVNKIESYLGPKNIVAGGVDFSMLVVSPTDVYDNQLLDSTKISISHQFNSDIQQTETTIKNGIAWKNIYSTSAAGRLLVKASYDNKSSKEMTTMVDPANASSFEINFNRNHKYADGNQIITFTTDIIKDNFGNVVIDGTLVSFSITNSEGMLLQTTGSTIGGIAQGQLLHPDAPDEWKVTAYVTGAAKSNTITVGFEPAVLNFEVQYSENGRSIQIEEIQSFMGQLVPDGLSVVLEVRNEKKELVNILQTTTRLGYAEFTLSTDFYQNGRYQMRIRTAGITKNKMVSLQ